MMDDRIIFCEGIRLRASRLRRDMSACALPRGFCGGVSVSNGGGSDSAVIDSRYKHARQRVLVSWEGSSSSHDPNFSRTAAFLLDAMAALPRKWVSGGAPALP